MGLQSIALCLALISFTTVVHGANWCSCNSWTFTRSEWYGGKDEMLHVTVTNPVDGWNLRVRFSQPVWDFQTWDVLIDYHSPYEIGLKHDWHNENLNAGDQLEFNAVFSYSDDNYPGLIELQMTGQPLCDCGGPADPGEPVDPVDPGDPTDPGNPGSGPYDYGEVLKKSILFYEAQRSGWLPDNNRVSFRGNSATNDGWYDAGLDLTGGWYDAGDHVKFGFPMAQTATALTYGLVEFEAAYANAGQLDIMRDSVRWALDYFVKCHPSPNEFYFQVGDGEDDHAFWGRPEDMTMGRPSLKLTTWQPGSDVAAETAAALAAGSMAFANVDADYAGHLLYHAKELYDFANNYRAKYTDSFPEAIPFYGSTGYGDELCEAAAMLYRATGEGGYLSDAENHYNSFGLDGTPWSYSWDAKQAMAQMILYQATGDAKYGGAVTAFVDSWLPGGGITYTPGGLAWRDTWGPNRYSGNAAFIAAMAANAGLKSTEYRNFAKSQINYMLGDSPWGSFVIGFGKNAPNAPHHRSSSCPGWGQPCNWDNYYASGPSPQTLNGALVGGPNEWDEFWNDRKDYIMNEVATDYNAGFQSAVAGVSLMYTTQQ